jgi:hypothetical protein
MNYKSLINTNYAHTYGVADYVTGELWTSSCDVASYALRAMLRRFYRQLRKAEAGGDECRVALFNCRTEQILMEGEYQVPEYVLDAGFKTEKEYWDTLAKLCEELEG